MTKKIHLTVSQMLHESLLAQADQIDEENQMPQTPPTTHPPTQSPLIQKLLAALDDRVAKSPNALGKLNTQPVTIVRPDLATSELVIQAVVGVVTTLVAAKSASKLTGKSTRECWQWIVIARTVLDVNNTYRVWTRAPWGK